VIHRGNGFWVLVFLLSLARSYAEDWPMYMGNLSHTSYSSQTQLNRGSLPQLQALWKTSVGATISAAATLSNGTLFAGAWDGSFYAIDAATGKVAWSTFVGKAPDPAISYCMPGIGVSSQAVVSGDTVYVAGGDAAVYGLDRATGAIRWRTPLADPQGGGYLWSSVMLSNNALYLGIASLGDCPLVRGGLARIALNDPSHPLIQYLVPEGVLGAGVWSTPAIDEQAGLVYVSTGNAIVQDASQGAWGSAVLALDATTLQVKSHFLKPLLPTEDDSDFGSSTMLFQTPDGSQYVAANGKDGVMYVLNRPDLSLAWSYKIATDCDSPESGCGSISTPAFDGRTLYTGTGQTDASGTALGSVYAIDPITQNTRWQYAARGFVLAPVTVTAGLVFAPTTAGLAVLDSATGEELWRDGSLGGLYSQAAVANGTVYATYVNGDIAAWGVPASLLGNPLAAAPSSLQFLYTESGPVPSPQDVAIFTSSAPLNVTISSDAGWLTAGAQSASTPGTVQVQVNVSGLAPGSYNGHLSLTPTDGSAAVNIPVNLLVSGAPPSLDAASAGNAATSQPGPLAPGGLFVINAAGLADVDTTAGGVPWPGVMNGITVRINGVRVALEHVGPTRIEGQVPFEIQPGTASLTVESNGVATAPVSIVIAPSAPAIFLLDGTRAAALNLDYSVNTAANPAPTGGFLSVYFTGQGQVDNAVTTGGAAPSDFLSRTLAATSATIGGQPAAVVFSGLAPGFVGLAQANVQVPDLPPGDYPLVLQVGDATSNAATISVGPR
jgi:uncharacterized protein (TIGR03437 family)